MPAPSDPLMFADWLADYAAGGLDAEATAELGALVQSVGATGRAAKLSIELTIKPAGSSSRVVEVLGTVVGKPPKPIPEASVYFVAEGGRLVRDDPFQERFDLGDAANRLPAPPTQGRRIDGPATDEPDREDD